MPRPDSLSSLLDYLQGLGARHEQVRTSVIELQFAGLKDGAYPVVVVEPDPFVESLNEGTNLYRVALWVLVREERNSEVPNPALVTQALQLADELLQQLLREQQVTPKGEPTTTLHYGSANSGLDSGVRIEVALVLPKAVDRHANPNKFTPLLP